MIGRTAVVLSIAAVAAACAETTTTPGTPVAYSSPDYAASEMTPTAESQPQPTRTQTTTITAATVPSPTTGAKATPSEEASKKRVKILATGGPIAGAGSAGSYGDTSGELKVDDLIKAVPNVDKLAKLSGERIANIGGQDMTDEVWLKLASRVNALLASDDVDGVVITHGTDTMEETAYFLNLVVKSRKPVILVGSMRPASAVSADGPGNLYNAVAAAASPGAVGRGVLVVLNDKIQSARDVTKTNTTNVDTFESPNRGPVGLVNNGKITWLERMNKRHTNKSDLGVGGVTKLPRVDVIYAHSNMKQSLIQDALNDGAKGIVVAGVGDGNMSTEALDLLSKAVKSGIVVVRSTRLPSGLVLRNNEVDDDKLGFVASGELNPAKSRVLLQLGLLKTHDPKQMQQIFNEY